MAAHAVYTEGVEQFIIEHVNSEAVFNRIEHVRFLIEDFPEIGRIYDPEYEAARPPFACRYFIVPDTPFALYYTYSPEDSLVTIFALEYLAANPSNRFRS